MSHFEGCACAGSVCRVTSTLSSAGLSLGTIHCSHLNDTGSREGISHWYYCYSPHTPQLPAAPGESPPTQASAQHWGLKPEQAPSARPASRGFRAVICRKESFPLQIHYGHLLCYRSLMLAASIVLNLGVRFPTQCNRRLWSVSVAY